MGRGHLKLHAASRDGGTIEAIAFGFEQRGVDALALHGREVDIAVTLQTGRFRERVYPELRVTDLRWSGGE